MKTLGLGRLSNRGQCDTESGAQEEIVDAMLVDSLFATASVFFTLATVEPPRILAENRSLVLLLEILTV